LARLAEDLAQFYAAGFFDGKQLDARLALEAPGRLVGEPYLVVVFTLLRAEHLP
jgi:hypothetical protein